MRKPKSFYSWMINTHLKSDGLIGKLARDMKSDSRNFTRGRSRHRNEAYMEIVGLGYEMRKAFNDAWAEYEQYKAGFRNG